ncbi:MAG TPA: hypothetical protein PKD90_17730, partial [Phnomibacter sp.]|nr:hypothetical protein [Phnomibacter sp.]
MNPFVEKFGIAIKTFRHLNSEEEKQALLQQVLEYANTHAEQFKQAIAEVQFDEALEPLPVVLEALSKNTDTWGMFYVTTLDAIFNQAKKVDKPKKILEYLVEYAYIEKANGAFVQLIVDRLAEEVTQEVAATKLAAIWVLPPFLQNSCISNKLAMVQLLQQQLQHHNWTVRYITYKALAYEALLPHG